MTRKLAAIAAAAFVSLTFFWLIALFSVRLADWFWANISRFPEHAVLLTTIGFFFVMMAIARRRSARSTPFTRLLSANRYTRFLTAHR